MLEMAPLPAVNHEIVGVTDLSAVRAEVAAQRSQLSDLNSRLSLERELADEIHRSRQFTIISSPALRLVFDVDSIDPNAIPKHSIDTRLSSAFRSNVEIGALPDGLAQSLSKELRSRMHPDAGGDAEIAKDIGQKLEDIDIDPVFSATNAIASALDLETADLQSLRDERYRYSLLLNSADPHFASEKEAKKTAELEIESTEWRVRVQAAVMTFELITGGDEVWNNFLQGIVQERQMYLISMVNEMQPKILAFIERLVKGEPISVDELDIAKIDSILERIWSTIGKKEDGQIPYSPPYQNWLEILLPALEALDPGESPDKEYTYFQPPIQYNHAPRPQHYESSLEQKISESEVLTSQKNHFQKYRSEESEFRKY